MEIVNNNFYVTAKVFFEVYSLKSVQFPLLRPCPPSFQGHVAMVRVVLTFMVLDTWAFSPDSRLRQQLRRQTQETSVFPSTVFSAVSFSFFQFAKILSQSGLSIM